MKSQGNDGPTLHIVSLGHFCIIHFSVNGYSWKVIKAVHFDRKYALPSPAMPEVKDYCCFLRFLKLNSLSNDSKVCLKMCACSHTVCNHTACGTAEVHIWKQELHIWKYPSSWIQPWDLAWALAHLCPACFHKCSVLSEIKLILSRREYLVVNLGSVPHLYPCLILCKKKPSLSESLTENIKSNAAKEKENGALNLS